MLVFLQQVATAAFKKLHTNLQNIKTHCRFYLLQSNIRILNHKKKKNTFTAVETKCSTTCRSPLLDKHQHI